MTDVARHAPASMVLVPAIVVRLSVPSGVLFSRPESLWSNRGQTAARSLSQRRKRPLLEDQEVA